MCVTGSLELKISSKLLSFDFLQGRLYKQRCQCSIIDKLLLIASGESFFVVSGGSKSSLLLLFEYGFFPNKKTLCWNLFASER